MTIRQRAGWYIVSPGVTLALDPYRPDPEGTRVYLPSAALAEQFQILGRVHIEGESPQAAPAPVLFWQGRGGVILWENISGADIAAGTPVDLGGVYGFALADIPNSAAGGLAVSGVWDFPLPDGVDFLAGDFVCVDGGAISASGEPVGIAAADSAEGRVRVHLLPGTGGGGGPAESIPWSRVTGKPDFATVATSGDYNDLINTPEGGGVFVATYNVTTAQEIIAYLDAAKEPFAPMLVKRGADYYTVVTASKQAENKVIIRTFATLSGDYYMFAYTITDNVWAASSHGFQKRLESGTNIKTINGQAIVGSGNLILHQGVGDGLDLNDMPSYNELQQMLDNNALLYIDGNWLVTGLMIEGSNAQVVGTYADNVRYYSFDTDDNPDAPLTYNGTYTEGSSQKPNMVVSAGGTQPFGRFQRGDGQEFLLFGLANGISISFTDQQGRTQNMNYTINPSYIVDKPEGTDSQLGNVVQVGSFTNADNVEYGIYEFYYRTSALPAADTTKVFSLTPLLNDYTVLDFIDATGVTENGHFIGSGRTDGTNRIIVQQFSKNNKAFTMRAYGDYTQQTALLKIKFIGTKN